MSTVTSRDGTNITYELRGDGPPLVLVDGALCFRRMGPMPDLARHLESHFTLVLYDRRGRGESGDTLPWSLGREVEDIAALLEAVGGSAYAFGVSSGAVLALDAASRGLAIPKVALYEPPFIVDGSRDPVADDFIPDLERLLAEGRRREVVRRFMRIVGVPGFFIALMRLFPSWKHLVSVAHTVPYDLGTMGGTQAGLPLPAGRWRGLAAPCLVMDGGKSPAWMRTGTRSLADILPGSTYRTLPGQTHMVKSAVLAPALADFFAA
jgi:pimeloyl-ACP methyl ester carboxylesterase